MPRTRPCRCDRLAPLAVRDVACREHAGQGGGCAVWSGEDVAAAVQLKLPLQEGSGRGVAWQGAAGKGPSGARAGFVGSATWLMQMAAAAAVASVQLGSPIAKNKPLTGMSDIWPVPRSRMRMPAALGIKEAGKQVGQRLHVRAEAAMQPAGVGEQGVSPGGGTAAAALRTQRAVLPSVRLHALSLPQHVDLGVAHSAPGHHGGRLQAQHKNGLTVLPSAAAPSSPLLLLVCGPRASLVRMPLAAGRAHLQVAVSVDDVYCTGVPRQEQRLLHRHVATANDWMRRKS